MAEAREQQRKVAEYYQCSAGYTVGMTVCQEGEVLRGEAFGPDFQPLSPADQRERFGRVLYREYTPEEKDIMAIHQESERVRALSGMQHPDMPPVVATGAPPATPTLAMLGRAELKAMARGLGLNFDEDTDRDRMIGAIEKKLKAGEQVADDEETHKLVKERSQHAKSAIEEANKTATGGGGGGGSRRRRAATPPPEEEEEEEETEETATTEEEEEEEE